VLWTPVCPEHAGRMESSILNATSVRATVKLIGIRGDRSNMNQRLISAGKVGAIGYGAMWLSLSGRPSSEAAIRTIHVALDSGVTLIDTADAYCLGPDEMGHNERIVARALREYGGDRSQILVATKGGHCWPGGRWGVDGRPAYLRAACEASLKRLGTDSIGLYQFHHPDPNVPFEESVGALADLKNEGKVSMVGLSNISPPQLEAARGIVPIASVQNQYNPFVREDGANGLLASCREAGIAYLAYSPLGGGDRAKRLQEVAEIAAVARRHGAAPQQVALAWLLAKSPVVIPIPGGRRIESVMENVRAADLTLDEADVAEIDRAKIPLGWTVSTLVRTTARRSLRVGRRLARTAFRR